MPPQTHTPAGLRSSIADLAWAVEERVVWGAGDALRSAFEVVKWPFEQLAWALEQGLVWPLQERTSDWNGPARAASLALLAVVAIGAGTAGLLLAAPNDSGDATVAQAPPPPRLPILEQPTKAPAPPAPVLHGAAPVFAPKAADKVGDLSQEKGSSEASASQATTTQPQANATAKDNATQSTATDKGGASAAAAEAVAGPAAIKVAHKFANAFVLYETGQSNSKVRATFSETATPQLTHALLRRPPRLPANVKVPRAEVLNLVAGPSHGGVYTISVSLLRVGLTSELRLDMKKDKKSGDWRVTDVLG